MGSDWSECTIGDVLTLQRGFDITKKEQVTGNVPVVSSGGIKSFHTHAKVKAPGVVLGRKGTLGTTFFLNEDFWPHDTTLWVKDFKGNNARFVYYFFRNIAEVLQSLDVGTSNPALNRNHVHPVEMRLPPLPEQKAIAHVLGSLDDKIELNRRMNETLEGMAQALFKSWFVDFDPVLDNALAAGNPIPDDLEERAEVRRQALAAGSANREAAKAFPAAFQFTEELGWIPEGWEVKTLSDLLEVKYGKDHKKLNEGNIPVYGSGGLMRHANKSLYTGESVLIPRKGTLSNILYLNEEFWTVDTMFYTIPKCKFAPKYTFYHLKSLDFTLMNVGSAVPSMTTKVLNALPILAPPEAILQNFDSLLTAYFDKAKANNTQSKTLSKLRDSLLPKLISGEVRIPDAEQLVEEALT